MTTSSTKRDADKADESAAADVPGPGEPDLSGDWCNFFLLLLLYTIQGLPLGLTVQAMPVLLQSNKNVDYDDQALFHLTVWPYTLKLLWAPLVDALYVRQIGRRKSWLIPVQFSMGSCLLYIASNIDNLLPETEKPNMPKLVCIFFITIFTVATQDIVVDGWALTMLKKNNIGYASTCNTSGLAIGSMISSVSSTLLTSEKFCNKYLRGVPSTGGIMTLKNLFYVWGILLIVITVLIAIFKTEKDCTLEDDNVNISAIQNYSLLWKILKLPSIKILMLALLTARIGFAATDHVTILKLVDAGISKDNIMIMNSAMSFVKMIVPIAIAKYTSGPKPIGIYFNATAIRLLWNFAFIMLIYYTPIIIKNKESVDIPVYYYAILVFVFLVNEILTYTIIVALLAFYSRISDARFGGTYMTLLNTLSNFGSAWSSYIALQMVQRLTLEECSVNVNNNCSTLDLINMCKKSGGSCMVVLNGYYVEMVVCTIIGIIWFVHFKNILKSLQNKCPTQWLVNNAKQPIIAKNDKNVFSITMT